MKCVDYIHIILCALILTMLGAVTALAQEVKVGIGFALPPYVIKETNSGIEVDIIRESFKAVGHTVRFIYLPNLRLPVEFAESNVDCVAANAAYDLSDDSGRPTYPSKVTITYQNYAITQTQSNIVINTIKDLSGWRVLAFNNAQKYLGPEFVKMTESNPEYSELADQSLQVRMLYSDRVQVVISDKRIFLWWRGKVNHTFFSGNQDMTKPLTFHPIFPPSPRRIFFGKPSLRDAFDLGLARIINNGVYDGIMSRYRTDTPHS